MTATTRFIYGYRYKLKYKVPGERQKTAELNYLGMAEPGLIDFGERKPTLQLWREDIKSAERISGGLTDHP